MPEKEYKIWAQSDIQADGVYMVTVSFSDDDIFTLNDDQAFLYATAIIETANIAEYEAAIFSQLRATKMTETGAAEFIATEFRPKRSIPVTGTPVVLVPGISQRTKKAFFIIRYKDKDIGQWDFEDALDHARAVLDIAFIARLDNIYHNILTNSVGVSDELARAIVMDIAEHRPTMRSDEKE
jgi:hypothetical protein